VVKAASSFRATEEMIDAKEVCERFAPARRMAVESWGVGTDRAFPSEDEEASASSDAQAAENCAEAASEAESNTR